ncbi:MAG: GIY-YIG nuclease family protein [Planctomycetaceae bacterium]|nr:GIY-YIG nuclease family protein [Planctomycetaceae bacterium]
MASGRNERLYVGVTSNLPVRTWQHREGVCEGWSKENCTMLLVYYEFHRTMVEAIAREKLIKRWRRQWKLALIERGNPEWRDLYPDLFG